MKILITPTQAEKFDRCKHSERMSIRLYVRKDHNGKGGFEIPAVIDNPLYEPGAEDLEGEGVARNMKRLKQAAKSAGKVAGLIAPAVALVAPQVGFGLREASVASRVVLGDGTQLTAEDDDDEARVVKRKRKQQGTTTKVPRYAIAKKKPR